MLRREAFGQWCDHQIAETLQHRTTRIGDHATRGQVRLTQFFAEDVLQYSVVGGW
jgi:hypothetical protein